MSATAVTLRAHALATFDDAVAYAKIGAAPTQDEAELLRRFINSATQRVENYTGRTFLTRTNDEHHDGNGGARLFLHQMPVLAVATFEQLNLDGTVNQTYTSADYLLDTVHGALSFKNGGRFYKGVRRWHAVFTASYASLATVPDDVTLACLILVAGYWRDFDQKRDDIEQQNIAGQSVVIKRGPLPATVKGLLKAHRGPLAGSM